eukprot:m.111033 g.111033  ORF g.111033 m.111033 type:complete len:1140 (-) comp12910_c0_seq1:82-3501(-)
MGSSCTKRGGRVAPAERVCQHCTHRIGVNDSVCPVCNKAVVGRRHSVATNVDFKVFRNMLARLQAEDGEGLPLDPALERIVTLVGVADVPSLLRAVGPKGRSLVKDLRATEAQTNPLGEAGTPPRLPVPANRTPGGLSGGSGGLPTARVLYPDTPPQSTTPEATTDDLDLDPKVAGEARTSRKFALDGLKRWPPPAVPDPPLASTAVFPDPDNEAVLHEFARHVVKHQETELRRIAQLGRADTASWHGLTFPGLTLAAEQTHVMAKVIPEWGPLESRVAPAIRRFWDGERREAVLTQGLGPGPGYILRILLHLAELMDVRIAAAATDHDVFSLLPLNSPAVISVWGVAPWGTLSAGDTVQLKWRFHQRVLGKAVPLAPDAAPSHVTLTLCAGTSGTGSFPPIRVLEKKVPNTGNYAWTVPRGLFAEAKAHLMVSASENRDVCGPSAPFVLHGLSREGRPVRMGELRVGLPVIRGPDWRFDDQDGGSGNRGTVVELGLLGHVRVVWGTSTQRHHYVCGGFPAEFHLAHAGPDVGVKYRGAVFGPNSLSRNDRRRMAEELQNAGHSVGTHTEFLDGLDKATLTAEAAAALVTERCAVCMGEYEENEVVVTTPCTPIPHRYHEECLKKWLATSTACPVCNNHFPTAVPECVVRTSSRDPARRPSTAAAGGGGTGRIDPFQEDLGLTAPEGEWICPECTVSGETGDAEATTPSHENDDEDGCTRCGISRVPWKLIDDKATLFQGLAQMVVDSRHLAASPTANSDPSPTAKAQPEAAEAAAADRQAEMELGLGVRRERLLTIEIKGLERAGWHVGDALQLMVLGERDEAALVKVTPDRRSAVLTRHLLRLVQHPRRLDRARQAATPSPHDQIRAKHFFEFQEPVFKAILARICDGAGPASAELAGGRGLLVLYEGAGWAISSGVLQIREGRVDFADHATAVDTRSKSLLEVLGKLAQQPPAAREVPSAAFHTVSAQLILDYACDHDRGGLTDTQLVSLLATWREVAERVKGAAKGEAVPPEWQRVDVTPHSPLHTQLGGSYLAELVLYLLGYTTLPRGSGAAGRGRELTLSAVPDEEALDAVLAAVTQADKVVKGEVAPDNEDVTVGDMIRMIQEAGEQFAELAGMYGGSDDSDNEGPGNCGQM